MQLQFWHYFQCSNLINGWYFSSSTLKSFWKTSCCVWDQSVKTADWTKKSILFFCCVTLPLRQSYVRLRSPDIHVVPGASVIFLVAGSSFFGGVTGGSLSFFRLLYGTKRRTGPVWSRQRGDRETDEINVSGTRLHIRDNRRIWNDIYHADVFCYQRIGFLWALKGEKRRGQTQTEFCYLKKKILLRYFEQTSIDSSSNFMFILITQTGLVHDETITLGPDTVLIVWWPSHHNRGLRSFPESPVLLKLNKNSHNGFVLVYEKII